MFQLSSSYQLAGDQPKAVKQLLMGVTSGQRNQVFKGVTGSGKTFSMAHVIAESNKPALIMAHNKTLAAQIYSEMKVLFPQNAVEYFVSYYDYYQPEAYIPRRDLYIEKDSSINEHIDLMRHSATRSLLERRDVIIVASVSCIYGLGSPDAYADMTLQLREGMKISRAEILNHLVKLQYVRNDLESSRGHFRVLGDIIDIFPVHLMAQGWRIELFGDVVDKISIFDIVSNHKTMIPEIKLYANSHHVTPQQTINQAVKNIQLELAERLEFLLNKNLLVEAQRLRQKTEYDIEMMVTMGSCKGIENYSRYLTGRKPGDPPPTLFEYLPSDALLFIDESHVSVPQIAGMFNGDRARKTNLVDYGFRLPSALDNRPLKFDEWNKMRPQTIFVSATPGKYELELTGGGCIEQMIRPTGLIDPLCEIRPLGNQIDDLINEIQQVVAKNYRILVTTITKKMAEKITSYLLELGIKVAYLHSEIKTLERISIIRDLRQGKIDVLVGVNLLREGLDIPECALVAILDADKEGFLRSETSLIQTIGRVARNVESRAILYADKRTKAIDSALRETERRRVIQLAYNAEHGITPQSVKSALQELLHTPYEFDSTLIELNEDHEVFADGINVKDKTTNKKSLGALRIKMLDHAKNLEFEKAALIRDQLMKLEK